MAEVTQKDKIAAAKKALEESQKLVESAQAQYSKAEALYNKAKVAALSIQALAAGAAAGVTGAFNGLASNVAAAGSVGGTEAASTAGTAIGEGIGEAIKFLSPEARDEEIDKYKEEFKKIEKKAKKEFEKAKKALEGAKKRVSVIKEKLNVLLTKRTLEEKAKLKELRTQSKLKTNKSRLKFNKAKLKAGLKKFIKAVGPIIIVLVLARVLNIFITRLADTVTRLGALVDKTNEIIQAATTKEDIKKAKVARDAALVALASAERQVEAFRKTINTLNTTITVFTLLLSILAALPIAPYQTAPIAIKASRMIAKFNPVLISLGILLQVSLTTLDGFLNTIQYERSRLLPLNNVLEQADAQDLTPEEVRDLLAVSNGGLGPVEGVVYNGFTFSIVEENDPKFVVAENKRRYAVALDRSGFVVLQSTPSFTLDPNVLIEELKLEIDKRNLEA
jgi:hypothetical protein